MLAYLGGVKYPEKAHVFEQTDFMPPFQQSKVKKKTADPVPASATPEQRKKWALLFVEAKAERAKTQKQRRRKKLAAVPPPEPTEEAAG